MKNVLTIAGSDSSGGAGIQADLKSFAANGVYGMSVITAVTAQNTREVLAVEDIPPLIIEKQLQAVFDDIPVDAVKIGMLSRSETIRVIRENLIKYQVPNIVIDPVMISKSGFHLLNPEAIKTLVEKMLPLATLLTPNIPEAEIIAAMTIQNLKDMERAAARIVEMGPQNVLLKGGHLPDQATDILFDGKEYHYFQAVRIHTPNTHGTGCTLAAAIAANLAKGLPVSEAVGHAKEYLTAAIAHSLAIGQGVGPVHHFYELYRKAGMLA
jgi:hydroxymethylpyrimidine/phosphomethylpyrimidine kinase